MGPWEGFISLCGMHLPFRFFVSGGHFTPGGWGGRAVARAAALRVALIGLLILRHINRPELLLRPFAFDVFGGLHEHAVEFLCRPQSAVGRQYCYKAAVVG
jgi:hypothetical protein